MDKDFEGDRKALNVLGREHSYSSRVDSTNEAIIDGNLTLLYADGIVKKLHYSVYQGCPEVSAELECGKRYNVGIPIFDTIEKITKEV